MRAALILSVVVACGGEIAPVGDGGPLANDGAPTQTDAQGPQCRTTSGALCPPWAMCVGTTCVPVLPPPPDASTIPTCGDHASSGYDGPTGCGQQETYACGSDMYEVDCNCPAATCACKKDGVTVNTVKFPACPACNSMNSPPSLLCGFPQ